MAISSRTATIVQNAAVQTLTGTLPSDRVAGDLVVAVIAGSSTVAAFTAPAGWTQLFAPAVVATDRLLAAYYRFDPPSGPVALTSAAASRWAIHCQAYGGVDTTTPSDAAAVSANNALAAATAPTLTTVTDGARLISGVNMDAAPPIFTQPTGMTLLTQTNNGGGRASAVADEVKAVKGATGPRAWSSATTGVASLAFLAALRPAPAASGNQSSAFLGFV